MRTRDYPAAARRGVKHQWWLLLLISSALLVATNNVGITHGFLAETESSSGSGFTSWTSTLWTQTSQTDFANGVLNNVDITSNPGDVKIANSSGQVTDTFDDEGRIASKTNISVAGGQVKMSLQTKTLTLRPNGNGNQNQLNRYPNTGEANWQDVCEVSANEDASYVSRNGGWASDLYTLEDTAEVGTINSITAWMRVRATAVPASANAQNKIRVGGTNYTGTPYTATASYSNYSNTWAQNPKTSAAWTWNDVNALEAGVTLQRGNGETRATQVWVQVSYTNYSSPGFITSINLLSGSQALSIDSFIYNASSIPAGTSLSIQFSLDRTNWYSSSGIINGWDAISAGSSSISLSALNWSGAYFYYKPQLTSNGTVTPILDQVGLNYHALGWIDSQVLDTSGNGDRWDAIFWDRTLPGGTNIILEVRASDTLFSKDSSIPAWVPIGNISPVTSGLSLGRYKQWRARLTTTDVTKTPVLHEVRSYYY